MIVLLFAVFTAFSSSGCGNPVSPPAVPAAGSHVLVVRIAGKAAARARTALPLAEPTLAAYAISVSRGGDILGAVTGIDASGMEFSVPLSVAPAAGDLVVVEGFDSEGKKCAVGSYTLPSGYTADAFVSITLYPSMGGTGNVNLSVSFPDDFTGLNNEITAAELTLYRTLEEYQARVVYRLMRYRKDDTYGAGENLLGSVPILFEDLPSGNYVAQIEFFRSRFVRVSRLVQTIIVRDGLTTKNWDGGGSTLNWDADKFASSNADLNGISIGGAAVSKFSSTTYNYAESVFTSEALSSKDLKITTGTQGQAVTAWLNGVGDAKKVALTKSGDVFTGTLTPMEAVNSIVITVTAPDGVTRQTYTVSYAYVARVSYEGSLVDCEWYVTAGGDDSKKGTKDEPVKTVAGALAKISTAYAFGAAWPGGSTNPVAARIKIRGEIMEAVVINSANRPPILLAGDEGGGTISGALTVASKVILEDGLAIQGSATVVTVNASGSFTMNGGTIRGDSTANSDHFGVRINGGAAAFAMNGGTISGNNAKSSYDGGGVYVVSGSFIMTGGTISGNTANSNGGGVNVAGGSFTMSGGTISGNTTTNNGGGVNVGKSDSSGSFTMTGGTISGNTANSNGGGVNVGRGSFTMSGGTISGNTAVSGGGVCFGGATLSISGGTISGNTASGGGGGVYVAGSSAFTMGGATVSGNTAGSNGGGGVYVENGDFGMDGATIAGNTAGSNGGGGGVFFNSSGSFAMDGGAISGNAANTAGGGVYVSNGSFTLSGGTINGNSSTGDGGGVFFNSSGSFAMDGGAISGNSANGDGGGVCIAIGGFIMKNTGVISGNTAATGGGLYFAGGGNFAMNGGTISGNTASGDGGGVFVSAGSFAMEGGAISGNTASGDGGGVFTSASSNTMSGGTISGNSADSGGGVYVTVNFAMSGGAVSENTANDGGGVYVKNGAFVINTSGATISGNSANTNGGGVYVNSGTFAINASGVAISGNTASGGDGGGGGVYVAVGSFTMSGGSVEGNKADGSAGRGGGVYVDSGTFIMNNADCSVKDNLSRYSGGGVHIAKTGTFVMHGGTISGNSTNHEGGGVDILGTFTMNGGTISRNISVYSGGGILIGNAGAFTLQGGTVSGNTSTGTDNNGVHIEDGGGFIKTGGEVDYITP
jgi:parallel beta-helix repeat protein